METVNNNDESLIFGRNAVLELLRSDRAVDKVFVKKADRSDKISEIIRLASKRKVAISYVDPIKLDKMSSGANHQGVVASVPMKEYATVDDILEFAEQRGEKPFIVIADGILDPHNLGAMIRAAECCGVHGVIIPKHRAAGLTGVAVKSSAGAIEHVLIAKVTNLASTVEMLKDRGLWIYAVEIGGEPYYDCDMDRAAAFILGGEDEGVSRLLREKSDYIVSIPMYGKINSLNVSAAAAVVMSECAHQRNKK